MGRGKPKAPFLVMRHYRSENTTISTVKLAGVAYMPTQQNPIK